MLIIQTTPRKSLIPPINEWVNIKNTEANRKTFLLHRTKPYWKKNKQTVNVVFYSHHMDSSTIQSSESVKVLNLCCVCVCITFISCHHYYFKKSTDLDISLCVHFPCMQHRFTKFINLAFACAQNYGHDDDEKYYFCVYNILYIPDSCHQEADKNCQWWYFFFISFIFCVWTYCCYYDGERKWWIMCLLKRNFILTQLENC